MAQIVPRVGHTASSIHPDRTAGRPYRIVDRLRPSGNSFRPYRRLPPTARRRPRVSSRVSSRRRSRTLVARHRRPSPRRRAQHARMPHPLVPSRLLRLPSGASRCLTQRFSRAGTPVASPASRPLRVRTG